MHKNGLRDVLLVLVLSCILCAIFFHWAVQYPYGWVDDDAYFYSQIAYNIATKGVSSFDGVHVTDGYHLLWLGILSAVSFAVSLFTLDKNVHLYFFLVVSLFLTLYIPWRFGRSAFQKLMLLGLSLMAKLMMETHLLALLFLLLVEHENSQEQESSLDRILFFILVFLVPLTRIDASVMVLGFFLIYLFQKNIRKWTAVILALGLGAVLHFIIMKSIAGSWFSVASLIKSNEASVKPGLLIENLVVSGAGYTLRAVVLIALAAACFAFLSMNRSSKRNRPLWFAFLGVAAFSFGHLYFSWMRAWYYVPGHLIFAYIFFQAETAESKTIRRIQTATVCFLCFCIAGYAAERIRGGLKYQNEAKEVAVFISQIDKAVPPGELIFQRDGSGYTGYFSKRPIFNGDGLVNDHAYAQLVIHNGLAGVLQKEKLHYLIANMPAKGDTIDSFCGLVILGRDVDKVLEKKGNGTYHFSNFLLYRIK